MTTKSAYVKKRLDFIEIIEKVDKNVWLSPQEKFEKMVDVIFNHIYKIKKNQWEYKDLKVGLLLDISQKENVWANKNADLIEKMKNSLRLDDENK